MLQIPLLWRRCGERRNRGDGTVVARSEVTRPKAAADLRAMAMSPTIDSGCHRRTTDEARKAGPEGSEATARAEETVLAEVTVQDVAMAPDVVMF